MPGGVWAVVVAAGEGRRFGGAKQFAPLSGRLVVDWSVEAARSVADEVVLVVTAESLADRSRHAGCRLVVEGGPRRADSVRAGLAVVDRSAAVVVVHDAARPLASPALFAAVVKAVEEGADAAVPGVEMADTLKRVRSGRVVETVERSALVCVQTPQAFRAEALRRAHEGAPDATDDAALVEAAGGIVVVVSGEAENAKITDASDVAVAEWRMATRGRP